MPPVVTREEVEQRNVLQLLQTPRACVFCGLPIDPVRGLCYYASLFSIQFMCLGCEKLSEKFEPKEKPCP